MTLCSSSGGSSGIITLKINEWSKMTEITRIYRGCIIHKTVTIHDIILVKSF